MDREGQSAPQSPASKSPASQGSGSPASGSPVPPSQAPAPHLVEGLRRLVRDIQTSARQQSTGLTGVCCGQTELLTFPPDGVSYCGELVEALVQSQPFEGVAWLLLTGRLPDEEALADWSSLISEAAVLPKSAADLFSILPVGVRPIDLFPVSLSLLSFFDPTPLDMCPEASQARLWRVMGQLPVVLDWGLNGQHGGGTLPTDSELHEDSEDSDLTWAGRLLQMLRPDRKRPEPLEDMVMNQLMICQCLTEMRPACFSARLSASTTGNLITALQMASLLFVSQLQNDPFCWAAELLQSFETPAQADAWWRRRAGQSMPFGFASSVPDVRARLLAEASRALCRGAEQSRLVAGAERIEKILAGENLLPTMDWMSARLMTVLGIPADRQALVIGLARLIGWAAQGIEQQKSGVSLLPVLRYGADV